MEIRKLMRALATACACAGRRVGLVFGSAVVFLSVCLLCGCQQREAQTATPVAEHKTFIELSPADIATAHAGNIARVLRANGNLRAVQQSSVRAKVAGEVIKVRVREGEHVSTGQVLARIDSSEYLSRLSDRQASYQAARAQAAFSETTRRKNEELLQKNFISPQAYDNTKSGADISAAQARSLEAQVGLARKALDDTIVRSPIDGWIAERAVQRGDKTAVDGKLFTVVDLSRLELEALVPANEIAQIAVGQSFVTTLDGYGNQRFPGRVARIGPSVQTGTRYVPIYIEIVNPAAALKAGLFAEGMITLDQRRAEVLVPITALHSESSANYVYVIEGGRLKRQPVELGLSSESAGEVEILKGLAAGAQVVSSNLGNLKEGASVRLTAKKSSP
jgi:membrane fusion protein (multidrug efflux system)